MNEKNLIPQSHELTVEEQSNGGNVFDNVAEKAITDADIKTYGTILHGVDWGWYPDPFAYVRCAYLAAILSQHIHCPDRETISPTVSDYIRNL